jgi:subtilisin family serine protease
MIRFLFATALVSLLTLSARFAVVTGSGSGRPVAPPSSGVSYRSRTERHKVILDQREHDSLDAIVSDGGSLIEDYGAFSLVAAPASSVDRIAARFGATVAIRDDLNLILLRAGAFDTTDRGITAESMQDAGDSTAANGSRLCLVQMVGPVKRSWLDWLKSKAEVISYIPNDTYLVRVSEPSLAEIESESLQRPAFVQWAGDYKPSFKIAPELQHDSSDVVEVTVQLARPGAAKAGLLADGNLPGSIVGEPEHLMNYTNVRLTVARRDLGQLAALPDVIWIEPWQEPRMFDERQDQIVAGNYSGNILGGPNYMAWLEKRGLASTPDFVVDIADSGLDRGSIDPSVLHKAFLDASGMSRIAYIDFAGTSLQQTSMNDTTGHGTLNASIVGGYGSGSAFPDADSEGYSFGLGVHPFARLGITKIFNPDFNNPDLGQMFDTMYGKGARISSDSWGTDGNSYTTRSQIFDAMVRDAQATRPGNQELTIVCAVGNKGPNGNIASPANAKNVIAVGASESYRPTGVDGCGIDSTGASDVTSIIGFSSGGPVADGRIKPDIVAPGTHIQGAQSQDPSCFDAGICGPKNTPAGQSLYTWSSGTSHSAPAVAGAAALSRQFLQQSTGSAPSPAMIKAYLVNSTTYLTGNGAGDNLPGPNQGWGLLDLGQAFDGTPRMFVDQTQILRQTGQVYTMHGRVAEPGTQFRVTLAWTDAPASPAASPIVNDLDLKVDVGGQTYRGNNFNGPLSAAGGIPDKLNNVESVWLPAGTTGDFVIRVIAANITGDGVPGNDNPLDQDFALVVYNAQPPPDTTPPTVAVLSPKNGDLLAGGNVASITWNESDDVRVVKRVIDLSMDAGSTFQQIASVTGPAVAGSQSYSWAVPQRLSTANGMIRITVYDAANNSAMASSAGTFQVWALPVITEANYDAQSGPAGELTLLGSGFRSGEAEVYADDVLLRKISYPAKFDQGDGTFGRLVSDDKKLNKRFPKGVSVPIVLKVPKTGQVSPAFQFQR